MSTEHLEACPARRPPYSVPCTCGAVRSGPTLADPRPLHEIVRALEERRYTGEIVDPDGSLLVAALEEIDRRLIALEGRAEASRWDIRREAIEGAARTDEGSLHAADEIEQWEQERRAEAGALGPG